MMPWLAHALPDADERDDALRSPQPGTDGQQDQPQAARPCPDSVATETENRSATTSP